MPKGWWEDVPEDALGEIEHLFEAGLDSGREFLNKNGEVFPFGMILGADGGRHIVAADPGPDHDHPANAALDLLWDGFRQRRDEIRAVGAVADVSLQDGWSALRVEVLHTAGYSFAVLLPYEINPATTEPETGQLFVIPASRSW